MIKKIIWIFIFLVIITGGYLYYKKLHTLVLDSSITTYKNSALGISFSYPKILTASTTNDVIGLHHDIPYPNHGRCSTNEKTQTYKRLSDFDMKIKISNKSLTDTIKKFSPNIPTDEYTSDKLAVYPGSIEPVTIAGMSGFVVYDGPEGCEQAIYYLSVSNSRTLVIQNDLVQALNPSFSTDEERNKILAIPTTISNELSDKIFKNIVESIKIN